MNRVVNQLDFFKMFGIFFPDGIILVERKKKEPFIGLHNNIIYIDEMRFHAYE